MIYLNKTLLDKNLLTYEETVRLVLVSQKEDCVDSLTSLFDKDYITFLKNGKARLTAKGRDFLKEVSTPPVEEEDEIIFQWLSTRYEEKGKSIGNASKTKKHIADFRVASGIEKNNLAMLCNDFLNDSANMEYNNVLEYAFYKPANAYATRFNLNESRIYQYYLKYKQHYDKKWGVKI